MKKSSIICGAALAIFSFSSCIENTPSAGVEAIRNGYAAKLNADAEETTVLAAANAAKIAAETALEQAKADFKQTEVKAADIVNQQAELQLEVEKARIALEVLEQENAKEEEIKLAEIRMEQIRYKADTIYLNFQKDSIVKVEALELAQAEYEVAKADNEIAIAEAVRAAEDRVWEINNQLTAKQSAESDALSAKASAYPHMLVELEDAKAKLAHLEYDIKQYTEYKAFFYGEYGKNYNYNGEPEFVFKDGFLNRTEMIADAEEDLADAQKAKTELQAYLDYLKAVPTNADEYTKELIRLEGELDRLSDEIGVLKLEKEQAEIKFNDENEKAVFAALDEEYNKVLPLDEADDEASDLLDKAVDNLKEFTGANSVEGVEGFNRLWVKDGDTYQWEDAEVWAKQYGNVDNRYDDILNSIEKLSYEKNSSVINAEYVALWKKSFSTDGLTYAQQVRADKLYWLSDQKFVARSSWSYSLPYDASEDADVKKEKEEQLLGDSFGLDQQIAELTGTTAGDEQVLLKQLEQKRDQVIAEIAKLVKARDNFYNDWKELDDAYNTAKTNAKSASDALAEAIEAFDAVSKESFAWPSAPLTFYQLKSYKETGKYYVVIYGSTTQYTSLPSLTSEPFIFAKQVELDSKTSEFYLDKQYYSKLVAFLNGEYEENQRSEGTYFDGTSKNYVNATTIEYFNGSERAYNSIELNNEIETVKELLADEDFYINTAIVTATEKLKEINDLAVDAKEVELFDAMLAILTLERDQAKEEVAVLQSIFDELVKDIKELTDLVNAQSATQI